MMNRGLIIFTFCGVLFLSVAGSIIGWLYWVDQPTGAEDSYLIVIEPGMSAAEIADMLGERGIIRNTAYFSYISRRNGYARSYKAGRHIVPGTSKTTEIARLLTLNPLPPPDVKVTVVEGLTIRETASVLAQAAGIDSTAYVTLAADSCTARKLGIDKCTLEGYLYPDTYFVRPGTEPMAMIRRMVKQFNTVFSDSLRKRAEDIGMSVHEVVTLASIIEAEVSIDEERLLVSAVFHKRLKLNMTLDANPTIQYALGVRRRVLYEDLEINSPYNTYIHSGLPPGPIGSPGEKSILAALYPAETGYLYFVADGSGGHVFSRTLAEHTRAVQRYRKIRKQSHMQ